MIKVTIEILSIIILIFILLLTSCIFNGDQSLSSISQPNIIYGDSRTNHEIHQKIIDEIIKLKPSVVFHTGDLVENGLIPDQWVIFNDIVSDLMEIAEF